MYGSVLYPGKTQALFSVVVSSSRFHVRSTPPRLRNDISSCSTPWTKKGLFDEEPAETTSHTYLLSPTTLALSVRVSRPYPTKSCGQRGPASIRLRGANGGSMGTSRWHAGPTGHQLVSDMLFMHYAEVFLSALERLDAVRPGITAAGLQRQDALSSGGRSSLRESLGLVEVGDNGSGIDGSSGGGGGGDSGSGNVAAFMGGGRGGILPLPAWCKGWRFCDWAGNYRCADTYFPLAGKDGSRLVDMVSESTPAVLNRDHSEHFVEPSGGRWVLTLNEEAQKIKDYLAVPPPEGFHHPIDMKW